MGKLKFYSADTFLEAALPLADGGVKAGFPSPAQDYMEDSLDLNRELIRHKESSFFVRVDGTSMIDAKLEDGDLLLVDRSVEPSEGAVCVCVLNGEFTVKHVVRRDGRVLLVPANEEFSPIEVCEGDQFEVWGVVTYVIHRPARLGH